MEMTQQTSKKRKLEIRKLVPPLDATDIIKQREKKRTSKNPIMNFLKTFFGEGF